MLERIIGKAELLEKDNPFLPDQMASLPSFKFSNKEIEVQIFNKETFRNFSNTRRQA